MLLFQDLGDCLFILFLFFFDLLLVFVVIEVVAIKAVSEEHGVDVFAHRDRVTNTAWSSSRIPRDVDIEDLFFLFLLFRLFLGVLAIFIFSFFVLGFVWYDLSYT